MKMCMKDLVSISVFVLKILNKNCTLTSVKGHNSLAKMTIYDPNIDIVNDNVFTKFGLNKSIHSQNIETRGPMVLSMIDTHGLLY